MDLQTVHQLFINTMHADVAVRQQAENQLKQLDVSPDMLGLVLQLIGHSETFANVKLAGNAIPRIWLIASAAIYIKNRIRKGWETFEGREGVAISDNDRATVRSSILEVMSRSADNIRWAILGARPLLTLNRAILTSAIGTILLKDYPKGWPEFLPTVFQLVKSDDVNLAHCGLLALHELFR
ncbi:Nonsense-mediated mRNA decay protein 5 [Massospora cicadina]|nr:Nonsense-mediated mRNA decay protein 5 [Massospora cicadina]